MAWELSSDRPIYTQILEKIELRIISGVYKPGEKLPSVRELAAQASVNPNTMKNEVNDYDHSLLILLFGVISLVTLVVAIVLWMANIKAAYELQKRAEAGKHINNFKYYLIF